ncbi:490_t:CDS:2 [Acaulospora colombiana]|uniref:490_t:CDS:1 n=1 Tax=Acaulospora colombiana TaxID=27376 RepID=A0ACA9N039_9GLOM|nr:490_t:CDS:2 [Acaulospora colombiana]
MSDFENIDSIVEQNMEDSDVEEFELKLGSTFGAKNGSLPTSYYKLVYDSQENVDFSKATEIELHQDEETLQVSFCGDSGDEVQLLTGQRFEDYTEDPDEEDLEAKKQCLLIYDEISRTWTLECIDYSYKIGTDERNTIKESPGSEDFEQKSNSALTLNSEEEAPEFIEENNEEFDGFMNIDSENQIKEENGHIDENGEEYLGDTLSTDDGLEGDDQTQDVNQRDNEIFEDEIIEGDSSSGSSSSESSSSTGSPSDSESDGVAEPDSSDLDSELGDMKDQFIQEMRKAENKPRKPNSLERTIRNQGSQPTSLAALFGGDGRYKVLTING